MDLLPAPSPDSDDLVARVRRGVRRREALLVEEWAAVVAWAEEHLVDAPDGGGAVLDAGAPLAGEGAPLVSEFHLMELVAALGRTPLGGRSYVGRVVECAWRLPSVYVAVAEGRLAPWRAERIADLTRPLNADAARYVDGHLFNARGCTWAQIDRLVEEAVRRHDPEAAEARRARAAARRYVEVTPPDADGVAELHGLLDAADGHDLDRALSRRAEVLARLGSTDPLDVRRSVAAGELARQDLTLDLFTEEGAVAAPARRAVVNVHLTDATLAGAPGGEVARWAEGACPVSPEQVRSWLQAPGTSVVVRPVVDLADHVPVDSYEIPDRLRVRVELRDHSCRFPGCPRRAGRCDLDHARPHTSGGPTCPCNLVPLCRSHHRAKTFRAWRYVTLVPGTYLWVSPRDRFYLVDHRGTHWLDPRDPVASVLGPAGGDRHGPAA